MGLLWEQQEKEDSHMLVLNFHKLVMKDTFHFCLYTQIQLIMLPALLRANIHNIHSYSSD